MIPTEDSVEILPAEGESGQEVVGFSSFGAQRINDAQKRRSRPTNTIFWYNRTNFAAQATAGQPPVAYWGHFMTLFDGTIIAGTRLDGQGTCWSTAGASAQSSITSGVGTEVVPTTGQTIPPSYTSNFLGAKGSLIGIDVFFRTTATNVNIGVTLVIAGVATGAVVVAAKVPQIGTFLGGNLITRQRPEGYFSGESGVQMFIRPPTAATIIPPGFVDPVVVGVPTSAIVDAYGQRITFDITP